MQMVSSSSSTCTSSSTLRVKIPATGQGRLTINVKSPTSEMYAEVKEADKVKDLERAIKKAWGNEYMALHHKSIEMKSEMPLACYNLRDGSIVKVSVLAEPPHQYKPSCETKKYAKLQLAKRSSSSNGESGCGSAVFHIAKMLSQFCSSIFPSH